MLVVVKRRNTSRMMSLGSWFSNFLVSRPPTIKKKNHRHQRAFVCSLLSVDITILEMKTEMFEIFNSFNNSHIKCDYNVF